MTQEPEQGAEPAAPTPAPEEPSRQELPSWNRSRRKRRGAKDGEEDAFQRGVKRAGRVAISRSTMVLIGLALVAGGIAGSVWLYDASVEKAAASTRVLARAAAYDTRVQFGDVQTLMMGLDREPPQPVAKDEAERSEVVEQALADVASLDHDDATLLAELVRAARAMRSGDAAGALALYDGFLARARADHPMAFNAREGRGIALEAMGDLEGALAAYEAIAPEAGEFYRDMALYHQGRVLERLERRDQAIARYKQYIEEFPLTEGSLVREQVKDRMLELDPEGLAAMGPTSVPDAGIEVIDP